MIEDAAQAHGAEYRGGAWAAWATCGCFSFYPGKNLGAYGEGGIVVTEHPSDYARTIRMLRDWGAENASTTTCLNGYNYRMEGMQGAMPAREAAPPREAGRRRDGPSAEPPTPLLRRHPPRACPTKADGTDTSTTSTRCVRRSGSVGKLTLNTQGIQTGIHYPIPVHLQPAYADDAWQRGSFPHSEKAADEVLSLPMYPEMTEEHVQAVGQALHAR